ncbi:MAG: hypothetical protein GXP54_04155 [Deltaproteobacteria bacterium]|nr:hypothetical protein [Deltaproteobacteria bacterium]
MKGYPDIIAAIATGAGDAAIGVVRLSGVGSHSLALSMCRDLAATPLERRVNLTWLEHPSSGEILDQAMVVLYPDGASYTGEEAVEFFCHGGRIVLDRVLDACFDAGARAAGPGDFTRRAVACGRLDLAQAEAVAMLSGAPTNEAVEIALSALKGASSRAVMELRESMMDILSGIEAYLDFTEDDGVELDATDTISALEEAILEMDAWIEKERAARPALTGVRVVLVGPPNAQPVQRDCR